MKCKKLDGDGSVDGKDEAVERKEGCCNDGCCICTISDHLREADRAVKTARKVRNVDIKGKLLVSCACISKKKKKTCHVTSCHQHRVK